MASYLFAKIARPHMEVICMLTDILRCHQPNRKNIRKMENRANFRTLQRMNQKAREDGNYRLWCETERQANNALLMSVDHNCFSRRWQMYH